MKTDPGSTSEGSSNRTFGLVFAAFFGFVAVLPAWRGEALRAWAAVTAAGFAVVALAAPHLLGPLNRLWMRVGSLLNRVVSPIALGVLFYAAVTPTGLLMRLFGKDPLRLRFDHEAPTYWIERVPPGPEPESLRNQF